MAEDSDKDKTESATSYKLKKARERGMVPKGMDLGFLAALTGLIGYGWARGDVLRGALATSTAKALIVAPQLGNDNGALMRVIEELSASIVEPVALLAGTIWLAVLVLELLQTGPVFAPERLKPDFGKLNPAAGLKRLFTARTLIEAVKSMIKMAIYIAIGWFIITSMLASEMSAMTDAQHVADLMIHMAFKLLLFCALAALVIALADQMLSRRMFSTQMKMSRREVRREIKDREGDPRIKQRRKQIHREFAKMGKSITQVRSADVVIVNPTHYAVALKYVPTEMAAPKVVARGVGSFAKILKNIAFQSGVTIIEDRALARQLYDRTIIDAEVGEGFYSAIANIYRKHNLGQKGRRT